MMRMFVGLAVAMLFFACGGDGSDNNTADQCIGDQTKCIGDLLMLCDGGSWALATDCADSNKTCEQKTASTAECKSLLCGNGVVDTGELCDGDTKACTEISSSYSDGNSLCKTDCSGYDTTTCTAKLEPDISVTDKCDDNINIQWRIFDVTDGLVWPANPDNVYVTEILDKEAIVKISCTSGNTICVGGAPNPDDGTTTWCVGLQAQVTSKYGDSACCFSCYDASGIAADLAVNFTCN